MLLIRVGLISGYVGESNESAKPAVKEIEEVLEQEIQEQTQRIAASKQTTARQVFALAQVELLY